MHVDSPAARMIVPGSFRSRSFGHSYFIAGEGSHASLGMCGGAAQSAMSMVVHSPGAVWVSVHRRSGATGGATAADAEAVTSGGGTVAVAVGVGTSTTGSRGGASPPPQAASVTTNGAANTLRGTRADIAAIYASTSGHRNRRLWPLPSRFTPLDMASPLFPEPPPAVPPTPLDEIDRKVDRLAANKDAWVKTDLPKRIALLEACIRATTEIAEAWVAEACRAKGIREGTQTAGEEWLGGPVTTVRNMRLFVEALEQGGAPRPPKLTTRADGQVVAEVFPANAMDKVMMGGISAEVWIEKGKPPTQGRIYREKRAGEKQTGKVALVLGAGNVASIGPMDALYKLFVEDEVVLLKTNPVNAYLGRFIERSLAPLAEQGFFALVHGGAEVGAHLVSHPKIDTLHMTGSDRTHDAIVYGPDPEEQKRRKAEKKPLVDKPISSELGAVTPVLVVPGPWSDDDMAFQARHVAAMVANNGSFNCNAAKAIVVAKGWALKDRFLAEVRSALARTKARKAYYPGAEARYRGFLEHYPEAKKLGDGGDHIVPWTTIPAVPPVKGEYALTNEAFCGVLAEVELDAHDAVSFLDAAVPFANDTMWGTLSCILLVHPSTEADHKDRIDRALAELRYGGIGYNVWAGVIYGLVVTTWGAFPGHPLEDIQSGRGVVHNAYLFDHPEKSIVRGPFRMFPTPLWFADHRTQADTAKALFEMEVRPSWLRLPKLVASALRG